MDEEKPAGKLRKLNPGSGADMPTQIGSGMTFPVAKLIELLEPANGKNSPKNGPPRSSYKDVQRWSGAGDMGRDIVAFTTDKKFDGPWDNYQCKRYALKLQPNHVGLSSVRSSITPSRANSRPANYYFAASKGVGLKLKSLLANPADSAKN